MDLLARYISVRREISLAGLVAPFQDYVTNRERGLFKERAALGFPFLRLGLYRLWFFCLTLDSLQ